MFNLFIRLSQFILVCRFNLFCVTTHLFVLSCCNGNQLIFGDVKVVICFNTRHSYCRNMYSCCTAEKWQSAVNETVTYNKNGVSVSENQEYVILFNVVGLNVFYRS